MEIKQKNFKQCDICKEEEANSLCPQCFYYFCEKCFKFLHEGTKIKEHKKEKIDYFVPIDIWCSEHEKNALNLFCVNEKGNIIHIIYIFLILL